MGFDKMPLAQRGHYNLRHKVFLFIFIFFPESLIVVTFSDLAKLETFNR